MVFIAGPTNRPFFFVRFGLLSFLFTFILLSARSAEATLPAGFTETIVFQGLTNPTVVRFSPDGRVFVAEKSGLIKVFNGLTDTTPDIFVDLRVNVFDHWDRGLLGMALDPAFPTRPYVYVLYAYDFDPFFVGPQPPRWNDTCPSPPGDTADGCVINARISKLEINASNQQVGTEQVLLQNNWCQQYPSHSIGTLAFGPEGALYASAGDGASFTFVDYGQKGGSAGSPTPKNPCDDPPAGRGFTEVAPTAEGGALRAQDLRTTSDPVTFDGSVLRINPDTGEAWPTNPLIGGNPADDRIIAYGLRNPFRFTIRPNSTQVWVGDVGWETWEEVNKITDPNDGVVENFGWPCYEGNATQPGYDGTNLNLCESLYVSQSATPPFYTYNHSASVTPGGDACSTSGGSSVSGMAFYETGVYPATYQDALFFADFSRNCIYVMRKGANGDPDVNTRTAFEVAAKRPVDLEIGPGGDLFYVDLSDGRIYRVQYSATNHPPVAVAHATPTAGNPPLTVQFDASASTDPNPGATLFYAWDLDGDGQYNDSTIVNPVFTYNTVGQYTVRLLVTDDDGATATDQITITVGNTAPTAIITSPSPSFTWQVGQTINFSGVATDPEQGTLPASAYHWDIILHHCPGGTQECHDHPIETITGVYSGSFVAPDHEWYAFIEFRLTVTDQGGLSNQTTVSIDPKTVQLNFDSNPSGLALVVGGVQEVTPFSRPAIIGSENTVIGVTPQAMGANTYAWSSWSDGGAQSHEVLAGTNSASFSANFVTWVAQDIGTVGVAGSTTFSNGAFTLNGSGADIYGTADAFHFVYLPFNGDGVIIAHVVSIQNTNSWAKAGIMLRETLTSTSKYAMMEITPGNGSAFQFRQNTAGSTIRKSGGTGTVAPYWLKLVRTGTSFAGYRSPDGINWTFVGTGGISMSNSVYIGLAVTSRNNSVLCKTVIDSVSLGSNASPTVSISSPAKGASFTAPATITINANASDSDGSVAKVEFYAGTTLLGTDTTSPFSFNWTNVAAGSYSLTVKATDNVGAIKTSAAVKITVHP